MKQENKIFEHFMSFRLEILFFKTFFEDCQIDKKSQFLFDEKVNAIFCN